MGGGAATIYSGVLGVKINFTTYSLCSYGNGRLNYGLIV